MEEQTHILINQLKKVANKEEAIKKIAEVQGNLKSILQNKGYKFYPQDSSLSEELEGGQHFRGNEDVNLARSYQEINYIKTGLISDWVTDLDETERFDQIRNEITNIIEDLE